MGNLFVIFDGMQDESYAELGGKTPYEFGKGSSFSLLEKEGMCGKFISTPAGFEADTQTCLLTLLGVEVKDIPPGRSYIEALALGLHVGDDDIIMRCNFVEVDENGILTVPCCSAPLDIAKELRNAVVAQEGHSITPVGSYKSLQKIASGREYLKDLKLSTPHQNAMKSFESLLPKGNKLAEQLADFSRQQLLIHKPYTVLNWGAAAKDELPAFTYIHNGLSGAIISKTDAPIGIALAMGMECPNIPTATGDIDTDISAKVSATLELLSRNDIVVLHIGGPDEATHRQNSIEKAEFINKLDKECLAPLLEQIPNGTRMLVTSDHAALCRTAGHTPDPVEFLLYEKGKCLSGDLGILSGNKAINVLCDNLK